MINELNRLIDNRLRQNAKPNGSSYLKKLIVQRTPPSVPTIRITNISK